MLSRLFKPRKPDYRSLCAERLIQAHAAFKAAKAAYDDARDRGDTRAINATWAPMFKAQCERVEAEMALLRTEVGQ